MFTSLYYLHILLVYSLFAAQFFYLEDSDLDASYDPDGDVQSTDEDEIFEPPPVSRQRVDQGEAGVAAALTAAVIPAVVPAAASVAAATAAAAAPVAALPAVAPIASSLPAAGFFCC